VIIELQRHFGPYLLKIMIPLLIILTLSYLVFFVPAAQLDVAAGLTVTSLLACIAFQWTVNDGLPNIGYIVTSDRIFHMSYALIMSAMAHTVYTFNLERSGRTALAERLELICRWAFPVAFILGISLISWSALRP
jgi:hypothetical protein